MQHGIINSLSKGLLVVLLGLLFASCTPSTGELEPQFSATSESIANVGYPAPGDQDKGDTTLGAYPAPPDLSPEPIGQETTPWPTFTPIPTPTRKPGPTPTALPLQKPNLNAAGNIIFLQRQENNLLDPSLMTISETGEASAPSKLFSPDSVQLQLPAPVSVYPSPDGKRLILTDGWGVRYVFDSDTGEYRPLFQKISDPGGQSFNWHPDGIHFLMEAQDGTKDTGLWLVNVDTGEYTVLLHQFPVPHIVAGDISPNGQQVIYALNANKYREDSKDAAESYEIWLADINGENAQLVWESRAFVGLFAWSPDGRFLAMNGGRILDLKDRSLKTLTTNMADGYGYAYRPVWSPDSRQIAFIAFDGPNPQTDKTMPSEGYEIDIFKGANIHVLDIESGKESALLQEKETGHLYPSWSPDGTKVAFTSTMSGKSEVWMVDASGSNLQQLTYSQEATLFSYWAASSGKSEQ